MTSFLGNLLIAVTWALITGRFTSGNLLLGFALGYGALYLARDALGAQDYVKKAPIIAELLWFFFLELVRANLQVARHVVAPRFDMQPAVVRMELRARGDLEILLLTIIITLTPGEIVLDVSADRRWMYIHAMYMKDIDRYRERFSQELERRILEVAR